MAHDAGIERRPGARGRIVMLVDNRVEVDSRVQKEARSAADAGWDVILLGRSPDFEPRAWRLGGAEVRLLPVVDRSGRLSHPVAPAPVAAPPATVTAADAHGSPAARSPAAPGCTDATPSFRRLAGRVRRRVVRTIRRATSALDRVARRANVAVARLRAAAWVRLLGDDAWRRLDSVLLDYERAYGPVIDRLEPDLIHANDFRMLGVGARAKLRAKEEGRSVALAWDAHEFLPGVRPWGHHSAWHLANLLHERQHAAYADAVVTVSEELADLLVAEHALATRPTVVLNAPEAAAVLVESAGRVNGGAEPADDDAPAGDDAQADDDAESDLRALCGLGAADPLVVYSGAAASQRGLHDMVKALPLLPGVHAAFVVPDPASPYVTRLRRRAAKLGVTDRVHVLPYVPHDRLVRFLAAADVGVIPIHHWPNHEIALITKFFEYSHARLPIVVSDVRTMAAMVRSTGQGEVFPAEDVGDYVRAVRAVLADPARYRAAYEAPGLLEQWTWGPQAQRLDAVYAQLLGLVRR